MAEGGAQLGQREWLVQVGPAERFEELERVAAHRVAGGEDDPFGHPRVLAGELCVHLAPREGRHPPVADEPVGPTPPGGLQGISAVAVIICGPRMPPPSGRRSYTNRSGKD